METTGDRIRKVRDKKGMTQEKLADACGISKGFLSDVENNNRNISSQKLLSVANALGASLEYLLRGTTGQDVEAGPIVIPPNLSQAAEELNLTYSDTLELINACNQIVARRVDKSRKEISVDDWKKLYKAIKEAFG